MRTQRASQRYSTQPKQLNSSSNLHQLPSLISKRRVSIEDDIQETHRENDEESDEDSSTDNNNHTHNNHINQSLIVQKSKVNQLKKRQQVNKSVIITKQDRNQNKNKQLMEGVVDKEESSDSDNDEKLFGFLNKIDKLKGLDVRMKMIQNLKKQYKNGDEGEQQQQKPRFSKIQKAVSQLHKNNTQLNQNQTQSQSRTSNLPANPYQQSDIKNPKRSSANIVNKNSFNSIEHHETDLQSQSSPNIQGRNLKSNMDYENSSQSNISLMSPMKLTTKRYIKYIEDEKLLEDTENEIKLISQSNTTDRKGSKKVKPSHRRSTSKHRDPNDSEESDKNLPSRINFQKPQLNNKEYLKLYNQKNQTHDGDRERAVSIVANLKMPKTKKFQNNPLFNKNKKLERNLNLHAQDLFALQQVQEGEVDFLTNANKYDDQIFTYNMMQELKQQILLEQQLTSIRNRNKEVNKDNFSTFLKKIGFKGKLFNQELNQDDGKTDHQKEYQQSLTKFQKLLKQIISQRDFKRKQDMFEKNQKQIIIQAENANNKGNQLIVMPTHFEDMSQNLPKNASNLTKEVQQFKPTQLRKLFSEKLREMEKCRQDGKLSLFNSDTLQIKQKKADQQEYRQYVREQLQEGNQVLLDKSLEYSIKLPNMWKKQLHEKYKIKENDIEPFFHEKVDKFQQEVDKLEVKQETVIDLNYKEYLKHRQSIVVDIDREKLQNAQSKQSQISKTEEKMKIRLTQKSINLQKSDLKQNSKGTLNLDNLQSPQNFYSSQLDSSAIDTTQTRNSQILNQKNSSLISSQDTPHTLKQNSSTQLRNVRYNKRRNNKFIYDSSILSFATDRRSSHNIHASQSFSTKPNPLFDETRIESQRIYDSSLNMYSNYYQSNSEKNYLNKLTQSNDNLRLLNKMVKEKLNSQIQELENKQGQQPSQQRYQNTNDFDQDQSNNSAYTRNSKIGGVNARTSSDLIDVNSFQLYKKDFDHKVLEWCEDEIKQLSTDNQRKNYYAIKKPTNLYHR
eukprot:403337482